MTKHGRFQTSDGLWLEFETAGIGKPVLWQHGLGADFRQPAGVFPDGVGLQRITLACRGHEGSDLGPAEGLSFSRFAADALALMDHLGIAQAAVGGISLGAGLALRLAAHHPTRVSHLILARPAWVDGPSLATQAGYLAVADIIARHGLRDGPAFLQQRPEYQALLAAAPDNAKSIMGYFTRPRPETTVALLSAICNSHPGVSKAEMAALDLPCLVIGNGEDFVHPLSYAAALAGLIPKARLQVITSKTVDPKAYESEFKSALAAFLTAA